MARPLRPPVPLFLEVPPLVLSIPSFRYRPPINSDRRKNTFALFLRSLDRVVRYAQRLQIVLVIEELHVSFVRDDMIDMMNFCYLSFGFAHPANRFNAAMVLRESAPALRIV
jgi:hypothetical protein